MRAWLAMKLISRNMARLRDGDPGPTLKFDAEDVQLHFPGDTPWAGEYRGKPAVTDWLTRFTKIGLQSYPDELMVKGPPWHMTASIRGHINLVDDAGTTVYDNRYVIWGYLRWGKLADYEVYEDTQKGAALADYLSSRAMAW
jgi:hypothetical protein